MANVYDSIPTTGKTDTGNIYDSIPTTKKTGSRQYEGFEAPVAAVKNFVPSLQKFAGGVTEAIVHPVQSAKMLGKLAGGAVLQSLLPEEQKVVSAVIDKINRNPGLAQRMMDTASQVGGLYVERYGTPERIERTFAQDPVGFAADFSSLLTGGAGLVRAGTAATAGVIGGVGGTASAVTGGARGASVLGAANKVADAGAKVADKVSKSKIVTKTAQALNPLETNVVIGEGFRKAGNALAKKGAPKGVSNLVGATGHVAEWAGPKKITDLAVEGVAGAYGAGQNMLNPKHRAYNEMVTADGVHEGQKVVQRAMEGLLSEADIRRYAAKHSLPETGLNSVESLRQRLSSNNAKERVALTNRVLEDLGKKGHEIVPGSMPSLAEAVSDLKLADLSKVDKDARALLDTTSKRQQMTREKAQLRYIGRVAKTKHAIEDAEKTRKVMSDPLYKAAKSKTAKADEDLTELLGSPSMERVMERAKRIAKEKRIDFEVGENLPERVVESKVLGADGKPIKTTLPAEFAEYSGQNLHTIKMAFDDEIKELRAKHQPGVVSDELKAIYETRNEFLKWVEQDSKIPVYGEARKVYENYSKPIDRMLLGKELKDGLTPTLGEDAAALRATTFENKVQNAPRTIKTATGKKNIDEMGEILTPYEVKIVNNLRADLRRTARNERLAKGAKGNPDLNRLATEAVGNIPSPTYLSVVATTVKSIAKTLQGRMNEKLARQFAMEIIATDLNVPIESLKKAMVWDTKVKKTKGRIEKGGKAIGNALRTPAVYNMLAPQAEPGNALADIR